MKKKTMLALTAVATLFAGSAMANHYQNNGHNGYGEHRMNYGDHQMDSRGHRGGYGMHRGGNNMHRGNDYNGMHRGGYGMHRSGNGYMMDYLNLSVEQQQKINNLLQQDRNQRLENDYSISFEDVEAMQKLIASDKFDEAAVRKQIEKRTNVQVERKLAQVKLQNDIYNVLTPEQKVELQKNRDARMTLNKQRMERRGQGGWGHY